MAHSPRALLFHNAAPHNVSLLSSLLATTMLVAAPGARAQSVLPQGGEVVAGAAMIANDGSRSTTVTQTSNRAVVDWSSFSVGQDNQVQFVQPSATSAILNRVTGHATSTIAGQIIGNGQVFLVNPNGIAITSTGSAKLGGGFVASTLDIANSDFMNANLAFKSAGNAADVVNAGAINIDKGGFAALLGGRVNNSGLISVPLGKVGLGAGEAATLDLYSDGFLQIALPSKAEGEDPLVKAAGSISGARIVISAASLVGAVRDAVFVPGELTARGAYMDGGAIVLEGGAGTTKVTGRLDASSETGRGGQIAVGGNNVVLSGASLNASGALGGGQITIGGGRYGAAVAGTTTAQTVSVDASSKIKADGLKQGNGGDVVIWSDRLTRFEGLVSAQALGDTGDGGQAEVSGKERLIYNGITDLRAANGRTGDLLLDPYNVTISSGTDTGAGFDASGDDTIINVTTLETALATANVTVTTGSAGTQAGNITIANDLFWSANTDLTLNAAGGILINANITKSGATSRLYLNASGTGGISGTGNIAGAGSVFFNVANAAATGNYSGILSGSATVFKQGAGSLTLAGDNTFTGSVWADGGGKLILTHSNALGVGPKTVTATSGNSNITLQNNITLAAGINFYTSGTAIISDGNNTINGTITLQGGSGGTNIVSNSGTLTLNGNIANGSTPRGITFYGPGSGVINGTISDGSNTLVMGVGSGSWIFTGNNTYTGGTSVSAGATLQVGNGGTGGSLGTAAVTNSGTLIFNRSDAVTVANIISGTGSLTKNGTNTLTLTGANTYSGATNLNGGTLKAGSTSAFGSNSAVTVSATGTLDLAGFATSIGSLAGDAGAIVTNSGAAVTLTTGGKNTSTTFAGNIQNGTGAISLTKAGTGTQTLSGTNSYSGTTTISAGSLQIGDGGTTGTLGTGNVVNNANIAFNRSDAHSVANVISGTGSLTKNGTGTTTLSGTNTYTGAVAINAGELSVLNASTTASTGLLGGGAVTIAAGANLSFNNARTSDNGYVVSNLISGAGSVRLFGPDGSITTLNAANTYSGGTTISSGIVNILNNAVFGTGTVTMTGGAFRATGAARTLANSFNLSGTIGLGTSTNVTGAITLAGNTTITPSSNSGGSTWSGAINLGAFTLATGDTGPNTVGGTWTGQTLTISGAISGTGGITQGSIGNLALSGNNTYTGATNVNLGTLRAGSTTAFGNNSAVTVGATGSLDLGGRSLSIGSLSGAAGGIFTNNGGAATLTIGGDNTSTTFAGVMRNGTGIITLIKAGTGTQTLTGANTYTGATTISAGTLQVGDGGTTGTLGTGAIVNNANLTYSFGSTTSVATPQNYSGSGNLSLTAGMVWYPANLTVGGNLSINSTGNSSAWTNLQTAINPVLTVGGTTSITGYLAGRTGGANTLTVNSTGAITLNNVTNGIAGNFWNWGTLNLNAGTSAINITGDNVMSQNNTSSTWNLTGVVNITGNVSHLLGGTQTLNINTTGDSSISGNLASNVTLVKSGSSILTLSGSNTYTGATTINAGTLKAGSTSALSNTSALTVGATGTLDLAGYSNSVGSLAGVAGGIVTNSGTAATLTAGGNNTSTTYAGRLQDGTGTLSLTKVGTGTLTLSGTNTHSGTTNVSAGTLAANVNVAQSALGTGTANIDTGATLRLNNLNTSSSNVTLGNTITGAGTLNLAFATGNTARTTILSNLAGFTGNVALSTAGSTGDKLSVGSNFGGSISIGNGTTLHVSSLARTVTGGVSVTGAGNAEGRGAIRIDGGGTLNSDVALTGNATLGAYSIGGGTLNGVVSGNFNLTKNGTSGLILMGDNTYTGTTTISAGTLQIGNGGTTGTLGAGAVINNANLTFARSDAMTVANAISGTGTLTKAGTGTTTLTGANTYTGATNVNAGTLELGAGGTLNVGTGIATVAVASGATLSGAGVITAGTLAFSGLGTINLTGNNAVNTLTASGTTGALTYNSAVQLGVNAITTNGSAVSITSTIADSASASNALTINNTITTNGGNLTLTGTAAGTGWGVRNSGALVTDAGSVTLNGTATSNSGIILSNNITTTTGNIALIGIATSGTAMGVGANLSTTDGNISVTGQSTTGYAIRGGSFGATSTGLGNVSLSAAGQLLFCSASCGSRLAVNLSANQGSVSLTGTSLIRFGNTDANIISTNNQVTIDGQYIDFSNNSIVNISNGLDSTISDNITGLGSFVKSGAGTLTLSGSNTYAGATNVTAGTLALTKSWNVGAGIAVIDVASGASLTGTGVVTAGALQIGGAGDVALSGNNQVNNLSSSGTIGALTFNNGKALTIDGITSAGPIAITTTGATSDITLAQAISTSASGDAIVLASGRNFINNAGASAMNLTGGGRFLVYSADWEADTRGGLLGGNLYNRTYGANPPNTISQTGSRFIYARQPVLTFAADATSRVYGDANPAFGATISGLVNGDLAAEAFSGAASLTTDADAASNVGAYNITASVGSLASDLGYAFQFSNNTLDVTTRAISVTVDAQSRIYGENNPALTYSIGGLGLVNGDTLTGALATGATGTSNVGDYAITQGDLAASSNYALTFTGNNLTVTQRALTVTADALSRIYGDANPALTYSVGGLGLVNGDTLAGGLATGATGTSNVGDYAITQGDLAASGNYNLTFVGNNLSVTQRALTVTADALSRIYGDANPALTYASTGLVNGDTLSGALATSATGTSNVGDYAITQGNLAASANYNLTFTGNNLTVTQRALSVTADALSRIYGDANPALTYASTGLVNGDALTGGLTTAATGTSNVGDYAITQGDLAASGNYNMTFTGNNLSVTQRALTVTADALSRIYGNANLALTYASTGLVNGDTLSGALATSATGTSNVGDYAITQGTLAASSNYALTFTGNNLTVTQRALTVTADALSRIYGDANPALTYASTGLVNGDTLTGGLATGATGTSNVGDYAITQGNLAASGNYALTFTGNNLTVTQRALTVTADALSRIYGDSNPALTYASTGLVNGDALTGGLTTSAGETSNVGDYAITQGTLAASSNYNLTFTGNNLTVTQRALTVTADALSRVYGNANPALTYASTGLVNGDTLTGGLTTAATGTSNVGDYAITQGDLAASANYNLTFTGNNLTVTQRALSVTADALSRIYGDANPALTYASTGLVNGDTLTGGLATTATGTSNVGDYAITQGTLAASPNYNLTFTGNNLTVTQRALSVTADALSRIYGDTNPALTYASKGLVNGDTLTGGLTILANQSSNVGTYAIQQGTLAASSNYALTFTGADLTVTPRSLTITGNATTSTYNANTQTNGFTTTGLYGTDNVASVTGLASATNAGFYLDALGGASGSGLSNYNITYQNGSLNITKAALVVKGDATTSIYNANTQTNGFTTLGLLGTDNVTSVTGSAKGKNAGLYADNLSGATGTGLSNYDITYQSANLVITKAALTVTGNTTTSTYNANTQTNGFTTAGLLGSDNVTSVSGLASGTNAGTYSDALGGASGTGLSNYNITYQNGSLDITKAALVVKGDATTSTYNANTQTNGFTTAGLLGSDNVTSVSGLASGTNAGTYSDALGGASGTGLSNYNITYQNGSLDITKAALVVKGDATTSTYNANTQTNGFTTAGLLGSDSVTSVTGLASATNAGTYSDNLGNASGSGLFNYNITYQNGSLEIGKAALTIAGNTTTSTYNANTQTNGFTTSGLLGTDNVTSVTGLASATDAGTYSDNLSGATGAGLVNYDILYQNGSLAIDKAKLILTGAQNNVTYNGASQSNSGASLSGVVGGDSFAITGYANGTNAGNYVDALVVNAQGATRLSNYDITIQQGQFTIDKAALTVTANDLEQAYNAQPFAGGNGVTITGLLGGDTQNALTGALLYSGSAQGAVQAGSYEIAVSGLDGANYVINFVSGALRILPQAPTIWPSLTLKEPAIVAQPALADVFSAKPEEKQQSGVGCVVGRSKAGNDNLDCRV